MAVTRVLVTGGAGFIGSHLCDRLLADGHEIVCLDNFFTGSRSNILHLLGHPKFELLHRDVQEPFTAEVDLVYHLACPASPIHYRRNPVRTIRTAVQGTLNLLEVAREARARMLIASTSEVYGDPQEHPQRETYWGHVNPIGPRSCYDEGKRCAEALATAYTTQVGTEVRVARIFNTYGPRLHQDDGRVVSNFVVQALKGLPITIFGDGRQTRSFCFVSDLVEGLCRLMVSEQTGPVNLGNPHEVSMLELAKLIIQLTRSSSKVVHHELPENDPSRRQPDITRAKQSLGGWSPRVGLEEGLLSTIRDFRERLGCA